MFESVCDKNESVNIIGTALARPKQIQKCSQSLTNHVYVAFLAIYDVALTSPPGYNLF